jgi:uncharacterized membrane protein YgcG
LNKLPHWQVALWGLSCLTHNKFGCCSPHLSLSTLLYVTIVMAELFDNGDLDLCYMVGICFQVMYVKDDFFDSLSCDALDWEDGRSERTKFSEQRKIDTETFGNFPLWSRGGRGGRGGSHRGGYRNSYGGAYGGGRGAGYGRAHGTAQPTTAIK